MNLGCKARDVITGFTGTVIAKTEWLNGCVRVMIQPNDLKDGKPIEAHTFDVQQVEVLDEKRHPQVMPAEKKPGGPKPEPSRSADPR